MVISYGVEGILEGDGELKGRFIRAEVDTNPLNSESLCKHSRRWRNLHVVYTMDGLQSSYFFMVTVLMGIIMVTFFIDFHNGHLIV